ncbi:MAG: endonuclease NucS domain-containing protein, partial [Gemmatimonadota bacterium]
MGMADVVATLREIRAAAPGDHELRELMEAKDSVLARYQPLFTRAGIERLTEEEFRLFLQFRNNRHWVSLQRLEPAICMDMPKLRRALLVLIDEERSIRDRLDELVPPRGPAFVPCLSKAVLTPILLIAFPEKYGVWNRVSEGAMKTLDVWPDLFGQSFGEKYETVNAALLGIAVATGVDLWVLDALWWRVEEELGSVIDTPTSVPGVGLESERPASMSPSFGLERHLHQFIRDNWQQTSLGEQWKLYEEDADPEAGYEYPCGAIGRIDLLARHRSDGRWLVVELKRNFTGDQALGQVLRYMGWVKRHLAGVHEKVEGLLIAREADAALSY